MAQLTLQIDSPSLLEQLKNVLSLMRGVKIVSDSQFQGVLLWKMFQTQKLWQQ